MNVFQFLISAVFLPYGALAVGSVSVMEGDSVTLNTSVQTNQQEDIKWYFYNDRLAHINRDKSKICTDAKCEERFRDRLKLDPQTGSLTITDIRTTDSGEYQLWINSSRTSSPTIFNVTVTDVPEPGLSSDVPEPGLSSDVPEPGLSSDVPEPGLSSDVPESGLSSDAVGGICAGVGVGVLMISAAAAAAAMHCRKRQKEQKDIEKQDQRDQNHLDNLTPNQTDPLTGKAANGTSPNPTEAAITEETSL